MSAFGSYVSYVEEERSKLVEAGVRPSSAARIARVVAKSRARRKAKMRRAVLGFFLWRVF